MKNRENVKNKWVADQIKLFEDEIIPEVVGTWECQDEYGPIIHEVTDVTFDKFRITPSGLVRAIFKTEESYERYDGPGVFHGEIVMSIDDYMKDRYLSDERYKKIK